MADRPQLFRLTDRKDQGFLLCPTHEEEITSLVARNMTSYRDMPLKLYQISKPEPAFVHQVMLCLLFPQHENTETNSGLGTASCEDASSS